jgi:lipoprotein-anchoring transpeptidase ErfK/SrfK
MVDYYSILLRAVTAPGAGDAQWRRGVFERARAMLAKDLQLRQPPLPAAVITAELKKMDAAIQRVEAEMTWTERSGAADESGDADAAPVSPGRSLIAERGRWSNATWIAMAVIVAALGAGGYAFISHRGKSPAPPANKSVAANAPAPNKAVAAKPPAAAPAAPAASTPANTDLAPGVDGGNTDADLPYVYRRQPTFYRTLQPVGTVIVDKLQHYLYLIQPNNVALRYGIGVGDDCKDLAGLHHITNKAEWPQWQVPPNMRRVASGAVMAGGPGNPLGARLLLLDDGASRIHGTNAPKTIGNSVAFGCIRLVNDDIVDLYSRVNVNTPVVVN